MSMRTLTDFLKADLAWDAQLRAAFGRDARIARYEMRGRGQPGDNLRAAYKARDAARVAHEKDKSQVIQAV